MKTLLFFNFIFAYLIINAQCVTTNLYLTTCGSWTPQTFTNQAGANNGTAPNATCNFGTGSTATSTWVHFTYVGPPTQQYLEGGQAPGGAGNNPALAIYSNNGCNLLGCSATNANPGPTEAGADGKIDLTTLGLTVGQEYLVRIYNEGNTANQKDKTLRCIPSAPCGDCLTNPCVVNNINTSFASSTFGSHNADCCTFPVNQFGAVPQLDCPGPGQVSVDGNVWYEFTVCQNGVVTATLTSTACNNTSGSQIWFLQGNCNGGTANYNALDCSNEGTMSPATLTYNCTAGQTYYIMVDSYGGNVCNFNLVLTGPVCITTCTPPVMTSGTTTAVCTGTALNFGLTANIVGTTFSWVAADNPSVSGESLTAQAGATINNTLVNNTSSVQTVTYTVTPTAAGCVGVPQTILVTVNPLNTITAGTSQTVCVNTVLTNITMTTTGATGANFSGLPVGVNGVWSGNTVTIIGTPTASGTFNYTVTTTGGCLPATAAGTITVTPNNTVSSPSSNPTLCINTTMSPNITFATTGATGIGAATGLPSGVIASFSGNTITLSGTPNASGTFNYSIPLTGGCGAVNAMGTITVTPLNTVTLPSSNPSVCINSPLSPGVTFTTTGATGMGTASGLPPGVSASWFGNTISLSGTPTVAGVYNYSIPLTGGCGTVNAAGTITVNALPTITLTPNPPSVCNGTNGSVLVSGSGVGTISWSGTTTGSASATLPYTISGLGAGNYNVTFTNTASGCISSSVSTTLINPGAPVINSMQNLSTCGTPIQILESSVTGTNLTANLGFYSSPGGVGPIADGTTFNSPTPTTTVYVYDFNGVCNAQVSFTVTVNPIPTLNVPADVTVCPQAQINPDDFVSNPSGATFSWINTNIAVGLAANGNGQISTYAAPANTTGSVISGNIMVTPTLNGCSGTSQSFMISINTLPTASMNGGSVYCSGDPIGNVQVGVTGVPSWTVTFTLNGGATQTVNGMTSPISLGNAPGTYVISSISDANCTNTTSESQTITVNPLPSVTGVSGGASYCPGVTPVDVFVAVTGTGPWTINYTLNGNPMTISGSISPISLGNAFGTYLVTGVTDAFCSSTASGSQEITLNTIPTIILTPTDPSVCNAMDGDILVSGSGSGIVVWNGTASGTNATATLNYSISNLGPGNYDVYFIDATTGCQSPMVSTDLNNPGAPVLDDVLDQLVCDTYILPAITGIGLSGSASYWTEPGGTGTQLFQGDTITSTQTVYVYDAVGACSDEQNGLIIVNQTPVITNPGNQTLCEGYILPAITGSNITGLAAYYSDSGANGTYYVPGDVISSDMVIYIYDQASSCIDEESFTIQIKPLPTVNAFIGGDSYCPGDIITSVDVAVTGSPAWTIYYTLDGVAQSAAGTTSPITLGNAPGVYVLTNISDANCSGPAFGTQMITINPLPAAPISGTNATYCSVWTISPLTVSGTGGTYTWYNAEGEVLGAGTTFIPENTVGSSTYTVTETIAGCEGPSSAVTIIINECEITVPTAITPDGDGINDEWEIVDLDEVYPNSMISIYNRWGNLIFEHDSSVDGPYYSNEWDGTYKAKLLPVGSFYYIIDFRVEGVQPERGIISILKK